MSNENVIRATAIVALLWSGTVFADDGSATRYRYYLAPALGYVIADSDRNADDGVNAQFGVGRFVNNRWNLELNALHATMDRVTASGEYDQGGIELDGLYFLSRERRWNPYGLIGVGSVRTETPGAYSTNLLASVGAGLLHPLDERGTAVRIDARYRHDGDDINRAGQNGFADWVFNVGFVIPFGARTSVAAEASASASDSDGDGVRDDDDRCANTAAGTEVDGTGCMVDGDHDGVADKQDRCPNTPAARRVDANGCEADGDRDGVVNDLDRCPNTPAGMKVNANGCEADADIDGVTDSKDACPGSRPGDKVDENGCLALSEDAFPEASDFSVTADTFVLRGVTFEYDASILTDDARVVLKGVAATLRERPELHVEIGGYSDNRGTVPYNTELSRQRAEAVREFLLQQGVAQANVTAKGYGPDKPIADNNTEEGRAKNRRVELRVLKK